MSTRVGDWQCPNTECVNHTQFPTAFVYGCKVNCPRCGTGKSAQRAGDWCCPNPACVNHQNTVYGCKHQCTRCGTPRPPLNAKGVAMPNESPALVGLGGLALGGSPPARLGDWHCPNPTCKNHADNVVYGNKTNCPICGEPKPAPPPGPQPAPAHAPVVMTFQPPRGPSSFPGPCAGCVPQFGAKPGRPGDWHCPNPLCKNHTDNWVYANKTSCPICATPKPDDAEEWAGGPIFPSSFVAPAPAPAPRSIPPPRSIPSHPNGGAMATVTRGPVEIRPGDWHCPNPSCKNSRDNVVYASKLNCPICGSPKDGIPIDFLPAPLARSGDWMCPNESCKNHTNGVYGSKSICTLCGSPKPDEFGSRSRSRSPHLT